MGFDTIKKMAEALGLKMPKDLSTFNEWLTDDSKQAYLKFVRDTLDNPNPDIKYKALLTGASRYLSKDQ